MCIIRSILYPISSPIHTQIALFLLCFFFSYLKRARVFVFISYLLNLQHDYENDGCDWREEVKKFVLRNLKKKKNKGTWERVKNAAQYESARGWDELMLRVVINIYLTNLNLCFNRNNIYCLTSVPRCIYFIHTNKKNKTSRHHQFNSVKLLCLIWSGDSDSTFRQSNPAVHWKCVCINVMKEIPSNRNATKRLQDTQNERER